MKLPIRTLTIAATCGLAVAAQAAPPKVPAALEGKLIQLKDGEIADAEMSAKLEYYVIYQSASW